METKLWYLYMHPIALCARSSHVRLLSLSRTNFLFIQILTLILGLKHSFCSCAFDSSSLSEKFLLPNVHQCVVSHLQIYLTMEARHHQTTIVSILFIIFSSFLAPCIKRGDGTISVLNALPFL